MKPTESLFALADWIDALPDEESRAEFSKEHLEPLNFEIDPYISPENGYHVYGMKEGFVVYRVDGTLMIATPQQVNG